MHKLIRILLICATLTLTSFGFPLALSAQQFAYVAAGISDNVLVIDTSSNLVVARVRLRGVYPLDVAITPDGSRLYVTSASSKNTVSVIATANNTVVATIALDQQPENLAITPDGSRAYVITNRTGAGEVKVIDTSNNTVIASVNVPST